MLLLVFSTAIAFWIAAYQRGGSLRSRVVEIAILLTVVSAIPACEIVILRRLASGERSAWFPSVICTSACLLVALIAAFLPIFAWIIFAVVLALMYAYELATLLSPRLRAAVFTDR